MNITGLFLNDRPRTGGHKRYLELLAGLAARGHHVVLLASAERLRGPEWWPTAPGAGRVQTVDVPLAPDGIDVLSRVSAARRWKRAVRRAGRTVIGPHRPDLVLIFGEGHAPAAREVSRDAGAPLVAALRSDRIAELDAVGRAERGIGPRVPRRRFERALVRIREQGIARAASRVVFQTDRDRQAFTARNPASRGHSAVIPNSIDASWFDPGLRDANRSTELRRLIFVGSLIARKGVLSLVVAFQRLVSDGPDLSLEICGDGPLRAQLERFVTEHQLSDRVALHGAVSDALRRIADADLLVLPSLYDSFPNVVLEALHTGTPALATRAGGAAEIIRRDDLLVAPQDPDALAAAVRRLSRDRTVYAAAREHMRRRRAEFEFDWVGRFESILQGVVASPGAG